MFRLPVILLLLSFSSTASFSEPLLALRWSSESQLQLLAQSTAAVRFVAPGVALVEAGARLQRQLRAAGMEVAATDVAAAGESYFLIDHLHFPLPAGQQLVYADPRGWGLTRIADDNFATAHDEQLFLYPLPETYALQGWLSPPRLKAALPAAAGIDELIAEVDEDRLRAHVESLSLIDPDAGSVAGNIRTRFARRRDTLASTRYIQEQLTAVLGDDVVRTQEFRPSASDSLMYNVVGELRGSDPDAGYYVICAHYDAIGTRSRGSWDWRTDTAPGADDNASGVALVLESARLLAQRQFPWSVRFIAWSGEELGLWGSRHYARLAEAEDHRILGVLNFDMIGFNDLADRLELVGNPQSRWLVELMRDANARYEVGLRIDVLEDSFAGLSDHAPFWARGYDAVLGIENYLPTDSTTVGVRDGLYRLNSQYHSVVDLPDSINWELVARVTRLTVAALAQFGIAESAPGERPNLVVFQGDLMGDPADDLRVRVSNIGAAPTLSPYRVRVSRCRADSSACEIIFDAERADPLAAGGADDITVPWQRFGDTVFFVEVDPDDVIAETSESDNRAFQGVRLVPSAGIAVYPNPYSPRRDGFVSFSGVPLFARVHLASLSGDVVWTGREEEQGQLTNEVRWRGVTNGGFEINSGIYLYSVRTFAGRELQRGKVAIVR